MIPRKQIKKYAQRTGGLFIVLLCGVEPKAVKREFVLEQIKIGCLTPPLHYIKKCYRLKKSETLRLELSYNAMLRPYIGEPIHKLYYLEQVMIKRPFAYARIAM